MTQPAPATGGTDPRWKLSPTKIVVGVILLVGIVVPLLVGTYAKVEPRLLGFPFFYWYQLLWVFLAAGLCFLSYVLLKREKDALARARDAAGSDRTEGGTR
ncbi:MAG: DUF3311 domain-containing protein [Propionibacteriaceae bacterium]|nr:MAG: DUF3311 domain-containing protein [Propionibacteriaceae bacterium]